jgi:hypothetical protein
MAFLSEKPVVLLITIELKLCALVPKNIHQITASTKKSIVSCLNFYDFRISFSLKIIVLSAQSDLDRG